MVDQAPDFTLKPTFPIASVIQAAQERANRELQARQQGQESLLNGLKSIGQVGQSLVDRRLKVAQALAIGRQAGLPDEISRNLEPEHALKIYAIKEGEGSPLHYILGMHPELLNNPNFLALFGRGKTQGTAASSSAPETPNQGGAVLTTQQTATPATPTPSPTPSPAPTSEPVQPPMLTNPMSKGQMKSFQMGVANRPVPILRYDNNGHLEEIGKAPKGAKIERDFKESGDIGDPKYQDKLEGQYRQVLLKPLSVRSGGMGLEDAKVNQAIHLRTLINKFYDPKTGEYNIPPSMHAELALGLARLQSPSGQVGIELMDELRQKTLREGLAGALVYLGADPHIVGGPTQNVAKLFVDSIDRQGQVSQANREQYMDYLRNMAPTGLDPERKERLERGKLNSFTDLLSRSPDIQKQQTGQTTGAADIHDKALEWANAHPNDPRAQKIIQKATAAKGTIGI